MHNMNEIKARALDVYGERPVDRAYLLSLESELSVSLPDEFLQASEYFDGSGIVVLPLHAMSASNPLNVLSETHRLRRAIDLPAQYLVLAEPPESLILMDCISGEVIWCDATDAVRVGKSPLVRQPETWESYGCFLAYLLDEEAADEN